MDDRLLTRDRFFIGGAWVEPASDEVLEVVSPSTEEVVGRVPLANVEDVDRAVAAARSAFDGPWSAYSPAERADFLARVAAVLQRRTPEVAAVLTEEMGIPVSQSSVSLGLVASVFEYYSDLARRYEFERRVRNSLVVCEPVGVVAAIVPWNAPITLASWKVAPALAAGCTVVLKPAPEAPLSNYILAEAVEEAGLPAGVVNVLPGDRAAGEHLVTHPDTDKVAFTGSTAAGKRIMSLCGEQVKRVSLELGGKSAALVLDDVDVAAVIPGLVAGGMRNSGQVCGAHTRVVVDRSIYDQAVEAAAEAAGALVVGDPHDPATVVGPVAAERQRERVEGYIELGRKEGARVAAGGGRPAHLAKGWYVEPTILADVDNSWRVAQEEIFGPVLCFIPSDSDDQAVALANDSDYGLSGSVWSGDPARALALARRVRTGGMSVNGSHSPFPHVPFGGFKRSGLGRELGPEGLQSFLEVRSIGVPPTLLPE